MTCLLREGEVLRVRVILNSSSPPPRKNRFRRLLADLGLKNQILDLEWAKLTCLGTSTESIDNTAECLMQTRRIYEWTNSLNFKQ